MWFRVVLMRSWLSGNRLPISVLVFLHVCTVTVPKYSSGACDEAPSIFQRKMLETTRCIARPHRKYRSLGTPVSRLRSLCDNRIKSLGSCFFSAPLCQDSDPCQDSDSYAIPITTAVLWGIQLSRQRESLPTLGGFFSSIIRSHQQWA